MSNLDIDSSGHRQLEYVEKTVLGTLKNYRESVEKSLNARSQQRTWSDRHALFPLSDILRKKSDIVSFSSSFAQTELDKLSNQGWRSLPQTLRLRKGSVSEQRSCAVMQHGEMNVGLCNIAVIEGQNLSRMGTQATTSRFNAIMMQCPSGDALELHVRRSTRAK